MVVRMEFEEIISNGLKKFNIKYEEIILGKFVQYKELLLEWNNKINLTSITDEEGIAIKHFIDSLSIYKYIKESKSIIDIGTGAGFPGIPIKILCGGMNVVLLDSLNKRINFLNTVIKSLELNKIEAIHGRAEEYGAKSGYREKFEVAVARAVSSLPILIEYCMPFLKIGGRMIAMKGSDLTEINISNKALTELGGIIESIENFTLPCSDINRNVIIIQKLDTYRQKYPRKVGQAKAKPLM